LVKRSRVSLEEALCALAEATTGVTFDPKDDIRETVEHDEGVLGLLLAGVEDEYRIYVAPERIRTISDICDLIETRQIQQESEEDD
jgi:hypothetical protein